ncbi:TPA: DUF4254 domain-containing protein [Legionella pneumophila]|uniref:DUF4254 domain-containing protein n=1 Tax=Legionella pneumophila TaxID=446 RepID=UPI0005C43207|nr:DUF4254 domain-containing protein [Legionella pneumophila]HAT9088284.1 DUF4254 domain-containing protein [Legionella pneumophila subsp. pneumophila]GAN22153.1 hypothetical protein lptwr_00029 [Legionella pneumophila]HAT2148679.1 DUF4254 domain-containing protein [Legionella pneumophila]HAT2151876.1 DUF4254 domain-containing protein [Legionella pneumophila]HAT8729006.1 DUF4254 domain-containing protein [Legionella pneumophila]
MQESFDPSTITTLHKTSIIRWKANGLEYQHKQFLQLVEENHAFNFQLWHAEDKARRDDMGFEFVYQAKREIDAFNQQRNNRMEAMDEWLYKALQPENHNHCPVNSESPGMIIDRLSILSLKSYHMDLQTKRQDVGVEHRIACTQKLEIIQQQLNQLALCLDELLNEVQAKTRTFRVYHQFKMYNDPKLNPELYCSD